MWDSAFKDFDLSLDKVIDLDTNMVDALKSATLVIQGYLFAQCMGNCIAVFIVYANSLLKCPNFLQIEVRHCPLFDNVLILARPLRNLFNISYICGKFTILWKASQFSRKQWSSILIITRPFRYDLPSLKLRRD